tara:strand:- start:6601 stop:7170 length:570 start_codon:yes stop_codon:yes gene_type:complete
MNWDEVLKVQITDVKQGVKTSERKLPEPEDDDCNRELQRLYEELVSIAKQGLESLKDLGQQAEYWRAKDYFYKEISSIDDNGEELNLSIKIQFVPFGDEKIACKLLEEMRNGIIGRASSLDDSEGLRLVIDKDWEGRYHDILFNAWANGYKNEGSFFVNIETADDWAYEKLQEVKFELVAPILAKLKNV